MVKYALIILLFWGCASSVQQDKGVPLDHIELKEGYQLNYNLVWDSERYQFIVDMLQMEPDRTFKYTMTSVKQTIGQVTLVEAALDTGRKERNNFGGGERTYDANSLTVWISRQCFAELLDTDTTSFMPGRSPLEFKNSKFYYAGKKRYNYELNGRPQEIEVVVAKEVDGSSEFWILNDRDNPLIIRMDVGWVIWLKEINFS